LTAQRDKEFQAFIDGRNRLNEQLDRLKHDIDRWLSGNAVNIDEGDPAMTDIAKLAGILETRKELLTELAKLDDNFIKYLLHLRATQGR
jgi:hypothetical protein